MFLKQSTAVDVPLGPFVDEDDGKTAETTLTLTQPDIRLSKNGAAFAQKNAAQTLSHMENGYYSCNLDATDTGTLGRLRVHVHESGALPVWEDFMVIPADVYDALVAGTTTEPTSVPASTASFLSKLNFLFAKERNKRLTTPTVETIRNEDDDGDIANADLTWDETTDTFTRDEYV